MGGRGTNGETFPNAPPPAAESMGPDEEAHSALQHGLRRIEAVLMNVRFPG